MAGYRAGVESGESQDQDPGSTGGVTSDGARALQRTGKRKSPPMDMAAVAGSTPVIAFGDPTITSVVSQEFGVATMALLAAAAVLKAASAFSRAVA